MIIDYFSEVWCLRYRCWWHVWWINGTVGATNTNPNRCVRTDVVILFIDESKAWWRRHKQTGDHGSVYIHLWITTGGAIRLEPCFTTIGIYKTEPHVNIQRVYKEFANLHFCNDTGWDGAALDLCGEEYEVILHIHWKKVDDEFVYIQYTATT